MFRLTKKWLGRGPVAYRQDMGGSFGYDDLTVPNAMADGLVGSMMVATALGWRRADKIQTGDLVLTFDRGLMPVQSITTGAHWNHATPCPGSLLPLLVPAGVLGNASAMMVLPETYLMIESDAGDELFGDPFSLVQAGDLEGFRGIERHVPGRVLDVVQLHFEQEEVVFVGSGALAMCAGQHIKSVEDMLFAASDSESYQSLGTDDVAALLAEMQNSDAASYRMDDARRCAAA